MITGRSHSYFLVIQHTGNNDKSGPALINYLFHRIQHPAAQVQSPDWTEALCVKKFHQLLAAAVTCSRREDGLSCRHGVKPPLTHSLTQLLAVGRWFPPGAPVSSTRKLISSSFHRLDMTLAVAEALNP